MSLSGFQTGLEITQQKQFRILLAHQLETEKMIKGCSWFFHPTYCRGAARHSVDPDTRFDYFGFRCASDLPTTSAANLDLQIIPSETITSTVEPQNVEPTTTQEVFGNEFAFVNTGDHFEPSRSWDVALGDLDGDGDLDAVLSNDDFDGMKIWFNDGGGIFTQSDQIFDPVLRVELGDLDQDHDLDIVVTNWNPDAE